MWPTTQAPVAALLDPRERELVAKMRATLPPGEVIDDDTGRPKARIARPRDFSSERRRLIEMGLLRPASGAPLATPERSSGSSPWVP